MPYITEPGTDEWAGMEKVLCGDCQTELGWQAEGSNTPDEAWVHTRCQVRIARSWGYDITEIEGLTGLLSRVAAACYPEIGGLAPDEQGKKLAKLRGDILAGHLMETLNNCGYKIVIRA